MLRAKKWKQYGIGVWGTAPVEGFALKLPFNNVFEDEPRKVS